MMLYYKQKIKLCFGGLHMGLIIGNQLKLELVIYIS